MKKQFAESGNFTPRCQSNKNVCASFYCIHIDYILELIELDLLFGCVDSGAIRVINKRIGVARGSPISVGSADWVLSCVEEVNACVFVAAQMTHIRQ